MSEFPQTAWFYTREGEKIGPVTFGELKIRASEGILNPRLDMAWSQGMETWQPLGEIEGLFERRTAPEPEESLAPSADPYRPPQEKTTPRNLDKDSGWPGARRRSYFLMCWIFPIAWSAGMAAGTGFLELQFGPQLMQIIQPVGSVLPFIVSLVFCLKRFVNLGMSRWWYLGFLVPFLNIWVGFRCFACPAGYAFHKKLDGVGVFLAILYWLVIAIGLLALLAIVFLLAGVLGSPEIQEQLREALRTATAPKS